MVRIHPDPPERNLARVASQSRREASTCTKAYTRRRATKSGEAKGAVAQLGERLLCKQEVIGSIPFSSTSQNAECRSKHQRLLLIFGSDRQHRLLFKKTEEVKRT